MGSSIKPEWISYEDQANELAAAKTPQQKEVHSQVLQNVLKRVNKSIENFLNGFGFPRYKGRNRYNSFTYPQSGFEVEIEDGKEGKLTLSKIGIDVGLINLLALSNGEMVEPPKFLRQSEQKLIKEQRRLLRKKCGSNNRKNQKTVAARVHRKIRNQRKDFAHKTARALVNQFDLIGFENLQIHNMLANHHLAKSIMDAGWYQLQILTPPKRKKLGSRLNSALRMGRHRPVMFAGISRNWHYETGYSDVISAGMSRIEIPTHQMKY